MKHYWKYGWCADCGVYEDEIAGDSAPPPAQPQPRDYWPRFSRGWLFHPDSDPMWMFPLLMRANTEIIYEHDPHYPMVRYAIIMDAIRAERAAIGCTRYPWCEHEHEEDV